MEIDKNAIIALRKIIADQLGAAAKSAEILSINVDDERSEIRIVVAIQSDAKPQDLAEGYFGLTGSVREALGERWRGFFPVITPHIGIGEHA